MAEISSKILGLQASSEVPKMELEERIARIERIMLQEERLVRFEHKSIRVFEIILLLVALAAPLCWALFELASFLLNRWHFLTGSH